MNFPKYDGNIHPDEWITDIQTYFVHNMQLTNYFDTAKSLVDSTIKLPTGIDNFEKLRNALQEDISFMVFKNTNKRKLQSLKYIPEREGGDTSKFISTFRKLCYNAEINDIEEQKKHLYQSLPNIDYYNYFLSEFFKRKEKINSMNDLIKEFEEIVTEESNLIIKGSIVALKHVATGKYLSSITNLLYTTGTKTQLIFAGSTGPDPDSLWKITFDKELATDADTNINLQHIKSNKFLGIYYNNYNYNGYSYKCHKSPLTEHTEVSCNTTGNYLDANRTDFNNYSWKFKHSKLENHQGYLKSNDIINLSIINRDNSQYEFLRSHDIQFTIGNDSFQEVVCHNERLGGNDEWCIELIKQV